MSSPDAPSALAMIEPVLRLSAFLGVLVAMAIWEIAQPFRQPSERKAARWVNNLGLVALNTLVLRLVVPIGAVAAAAWAQSQGIGLFNLVALPFVLEVLAVIVLMDLAIWTQHLVFHHVPVLWRLHRLHHADTEFDVTTGVRFHPIEIVLSMVIKIAVVVALGAPPEAVILFEIILSASSLFEHANATFPPRVEKVIRAVLVTPDMHRIHHSVKPHETNSNFGFNFSVWDRLFRTYRAEPEGGREGLVIGIERFREPREIWIDRLMTQPFRRGVDTVTPADQPVSRS